MRPEPICHSPEDAVRQRAGAALAGATLSSAIGSGWNADRAMDDIREQLTFTPRSLGETGHVQTIQYIQRELAANHINNVELQQWQTQNADGEPLMLTNIIARLDPANPDRVIVGTHYDSIVIAYADRDHPKAPMPGANNSASGVALLLETIRALGQRLGLKIGVDFIFFDGEEGINSLGAGDPHWAAVGSPYFARHIREFYPASLPRSAVIFDMVCDKDLRLHTEPLSVRAAKSEVQKFWSIGGQVAPSIFSTKRGKLPIHDDHNALIDAGVPSFLVIDFDYAPWFNTTQDTIDKCAPQSLEAVGNTLLLYLYEQAPAL